MLIKSTVKKTFVPIGTLVALDIHHVGITEGGVMMPDTAKAFRSCTATVIAVGPECKQVKEGDLVIAPDRLMCHEVLFRGQKLHIADEKGLLAVAIKEPSPDNN